MSRPSKTLWAQTRHPTNPDPGHRSLTSPEIKRLRKTIALANKTPPHALASSSERNLHGSVVLIVVPASPQALEMLDLHVHANPAVFRSISPPNHHSRASCSLRPTHTSLTYTDLSVCKSCGCWSSPNHGNPMLTPCHQALRVIDFPRECAPHPLSRTTGALGLPISGEGPRL